MPVGQISFLKLLICSSGLWSVGVIILMCLIISLSTTFSKTIDYAQVDSASIIWSSAHSQFNSFAFGRVTPAMTWTPASRLTCCLSSLSQQSNPHNWCFHHTAPLLYVVYQQKLNTQTFQPSFPGSLSTFSIYSALNSKVFPALQLSFPFLLTLLQDHSPLQYSQPRLLTQQAPVSCRVLLSHTFCPVVLESITCPLSSSLPP